MCDVAHYLQSQPTHEFRPSDDELGTNGGLDKGKHSTAVVDVNKDGNAVDDSQCDLNRLQLEALDSQDAFYRRESS